MSAVPAPDDGLAVGSVVDGRYRIDGVLGSGGMGRVYRGEHTGIGRAVAIKVLHADLGGNREAVTRFQREALASGRLDHPNIVAVSDFGELADGAAFLVMEALEGEPLGARLERGRLPWREALAVLRGVLAGLAHAHERGVVHRDIKPDNVFLAKKDDQLLVKVLDFGIAKLFAGIVDDPATTRAGLTIGTPAYLSPEQAVGGEITPQTDLYSTTVVLFEMLTGRAPFEAEDPLQMLGAHAAGVPPKLRDVAPDIELPPGMEELVQRGLAKRGADRWSTALAYLAELDRLAGEGGKPVAPSVFASQPVAILAGAVPDLDASQSDTRPIAQTPPRAAAAARPIGLDVTAALETRVTEVDTPAVIGQAPTLSLTPLPAERRAPLPPVARAVTLGDVVQEPVPRSWLVIGGAILGGAVLLAIVLALASHHGAAAEPMDAAVAMIAPPAAAAVNGKSGVAAKPGPVKPAKPEPAVIAPPVPPDPTAGSAVAAPDETPEARTLHDRSYKAAVHQLEASRACADRRAAIPKLVALADTRAIAVLKTARNRPFGRSNANACLVGDIDAAMKKFADTVPAGEK